MNSQHPCRHSLHFIFHVEVKLFAIEAGKMFSSAAFAYRGGAFDDERVFNSGAVLVQHPRGALLFDAGFGSNLDAHVATNPWLARTLTRYEAETTVAEQLAAAGIAPRDLLGIVPTHAHWDHVSGVSDLPGCAGSRQPSGAQLHYERRGTDCARTNARDRNLSLV